MHKLEDRYRSSHTKINPRHRDLNESVDSSRIISPLSLFEFSSDEIRVRRAIDLISSFDFTQDEEWFRAAGVDVEPHIDKTLMNLYRVFKRWYAEASETEGSSPGHLTQRCAEYTALFLSGDSHEDETICAFAAAFMEEFSGFDKKLRHHIATMPEELRSTVNAVRLQDGAAPIEGSFIDGKRTVFSARELNLESELTKVIGEVQLDQARQFSGDFSEAGLEGIAEVIEQVGGVLKHLRLADTNEFVAGVITDAASLLAPYLTTQPSPFNYELVLAFLTRLKREDLTLLP